MKVRRYTGSHYRGNNADIERVAQAIRSTFDEIPEKPSGTRGMLERLVELTGGEISVVDDPSQQEAEGGSLVIQKGGGYRIYLSPYTTPLRDNFTIAHELGHYFLHFHFQREKPELPIGFTRYGTGLVEWQANRFAAALLMPEDEFREKHQEFSGDPFLLAGWFDVSLPAVQVRGESLGVPVNSDTRN